MDTEPPCCLPPPRTQVTSFIDGSTIYGSSEAEAKFLRAFEGGQLLSQRTAAGEELPPADLATLDCRRGAQDPPCFSSGDPRVNADLGLGLMHSVWLREHNRVARSLQALNPQWDDERTFQEARRIVGAELQYITYNEFLPALLGPEVVERFGLRLENQGYFRGYDKRRLPGVTNVMPPPEPGPWPPRRPRRYAAGPTSRSVRETRARPRCTGRKLVLRASVFSETQAQNNSTHQAWHRCFSL
ncbi:hypothetical protein HPB48_011799 [Haemaphysalis longicornis]|uniref:Uncharacterized protein n=1 Tax=Haemaphysalis longicornis TaxID=44386 RepID=A0A9J6FPR7_HAELO|nr:hypothetical protein HPB48_011799 [Haemaphysalis longicornis]